MASLLLRPEIEPSFQWLQTLHASWTPVSRLYKTQGLPDDIMELGRYRNSIYTYSVGVRGPEEQREIRYLVNKSER